MVADNIGLLAQRINSDEGLDYLRSNLRLCQMAAEAISESISIRLEAGEDAELLDLRGQLMALTCQLEHARAVADRTTA